MKPDNKSIVRDYYEKVVNTGQVDLVEQYIAADYTEVYNNRRYTKGIEGAREHIAGVRQTYPDLVLTIQEQIAEGDMVATIYTMHGTHKGTWMGIKPTGKTIEVTGVNVDKVMNGKITEHGGAANLFDGLLTIGAIQVIGE